jgi:predicted aspartyl protease
MRVLVREWSVTTTMGTKFKVLLAIFVCIYCIVAGYMVWNSRRAAPPQTYSLPSQGVHIPFTFHNGLIHVSAKANGKPASWLVDTGSTQVIWPARFLPREAASQPFKYQGTVDDMWVTATMGTLRHLDIGDYKIAYIPGARVESKTVQEFILGNPALKDTCAVFDFKKHELILQESSAAKYPKRSSSHVLSLLQTSYPVANGGPLVVTGKLAGKPAKFVIDTGATGIFVSESFADKYLKSYHRGSIKVTGVSGSRVGSTVKDVSGDIAGLSFFTNQASIIREVPYADAIIGTEFLKHFRVTIDYPKMKLILEKR